VLEFVQLFCFTNEDIEVFVEETNRYAEQFFEKTPRDTLPPKSRMRDWEPTDANEMKAFLALTILMGLVVKADLDEYWTTSPLVETPFFGAVMSRNRFELLLKFFHIADSSGAKKKGEEGYDPLYRIRLLHDRYLKRSQETYTPEQNLALDEATMLWKGHVSYRVHNPNKPDKFGVKLYVVCESSSGYIVNWQVYTGKTEDPQEHGHTYRVVIDLLPDHLRGKGYRVYMDRYYSSPKLFHDLWSKELGATGTVMPNRKEMPKRAVQQKLQKGETVTVYKTHPNQLSCVKWKDKRDIYMLSNIVPVDTTHPFVVLEHTSWFSYGFPTFLACFPTVLHLYRINIGEHVNISLVLPLYTCQNQPFIKRYTMVKQLPSTRLTLTNCHV
jgi:hypothetical protein